MYDPHVAGSAHGVRLFACELDMALPLINTPRAGTELEQYNPTAQVTVIGFLNSVPSDGLRVAVLS